MYIRWIVSCHKQEDELRRKTPNNRKHNSQYLANNKLILEVQSHAEVDTLIHICTHRFSDRCMHGCTDSCKY